MLYRRLLTYVASMAAASLMTNAVIARPGDGPDQAPVIWAKVAGQYCSGFLSVSEIGELDAFLAKAASELAQIEEAEKGPEGLSFAELAKVISKDAEKKYRDPQNCDDSARQNAQWALQLARERTASGKPLYPQDGEPTLSDIAKAKLMGERCPKGTLTELELSQAKSFTGYILGLDC